MKLYVVPTPVGNLEDMTIRAIRILRDEVDLVVAEDTRTTSILLNHYQIKKPSTSFHKFNEHAAVDNIVNRILSGERVALVSDAGTPSICDPGYLLVRRCVDCGIEVETLPGATAFVPALVNSGLPSDKFVFEGFLPVKKGRATRIGLLASQTHTIILYESPHRLVKTLVQLGEAMGVERRVSVSREISKRFEQTIRGTIGEVVAHFEATPPKGEIVIIIEGNHSIK